MRLNKYLAELGVGSRRAVDSLVAKGEVKVNGRVAVLGEQIDPDKDKVRVGGKIVGGISKKVYIMINKPKGMISTAKDSEGRPTVLDLIPKMKERVYPVGRLDQETTGLLLLTNDGELAYKLTHPKFEIEKKYVVTARGKIEPGQLEKMRKGVRLEDGVTAPAEVWPLMFIEGKQLLEVTIHEGKKRQIRRMCEVVGIDLIDLQRVKMGTLELETLMEGKWRNLTEGEINSLRKSVQTSHRR